MIWIQKAGLGPGLWPLGVKKPDWTGLPNTSWFRSRDAEPCLLRLHDIPEAPEDHFLQPLNCFVLSQVLFVLLYLHFDETSHRLTNKARVGALGAWVPPKCHRQPQVSYIYAGVGVSTGAWRSSLKTSLSKDCSLGLSKFQMKDCRKTGLYGPV